MKYGKLEKKNAYGLIPYINNISYWKLPIVSAYKTISEGHSLFHLTVLIRSILVHCVPDGC